MSFLRRLFGRRAQTVVAPVQGIKDCCLVAENLVLIEQRSAVQPLGEPIPVEVRRCSVCGCKHHRMIVGKRMQPGHVGIGG